jgi:predicted alpha/beta-fold hydrolase
VAAVCAPLDLDCGARALDAPRAWLYRRHILAGLRATYARYAARHPQATPVARVRRARTMRAFDSLTVVPRFGFADADDYYRSQSVGPHLASITLPALLVYARHDPIVSPETVAGHVARLGSAASVWWLERAGHVGFPERIAVDGQSPARLEDRILDWLDAHSGRD